MADDLHNRPWIVQKYGGTSIGKLLARITTDIVPQYLVTSKVAVVCSALSGTVKSKGTTTLLLDAVRLATTSETSTDQLDLVIDALKASHLDAARIAIRSRIGAESERLEDELQSQISADCEHVRSILRASWTIGELSERTQDRVLATGEKLACRIVAASLRNMVSPNITVMTCSTDQISRASMPRLYSLTILKYADKAVVETVVGKNFMLHNG